MNSNYGRGSSGSLKNFDFDLGIGSNRPKSLNDQKSQTTSTPSYSSSSSSVHPKPSWQPNKPSWSHQPAPTQTSRPGLSGPTSMVGDIYGKTWNSSVPSAGNNSTIGVVNKDPNLFGDLVGSALGQVKSNSNVPLKSATPASNPSGKNVYSMGNLSGSLPRTSDPPKTSASWASSASGGFASTANNVNVNVGANKSSNLGGPSIKSMAAGIGGNGTSSNKDPFGSLVDFSSKGSSNLNSGGKANKTSSGDDTFGDFQNVPKTSTEAFPSSGFTSNSYDFMGSSNSGDFMGSNASSGFDMGDFGMPARNVGSQNQSSTQNPSGDPLDMLFPPSLSSGSSAPAAGGGGAGQHQFSGVEDWDFDPGLGGAGMHDDGGSTTELDGLPPPPGGVTASTAKSKGVDNQKQGQYADAIKWLSWAVILLEKTGYNADTMEVLSSRASCYKEVGEYKKAVADCSKILDQDESNVSVLVQRALLYESMEKYRLGADDLRTVLKIDPGNRIARSTIHRLNKMAE